MEKIVVSYLNDSHPNIFLKKTKFGNAVCKFGNAHMTWRSHKVDVIMPTIMGLFSLDWETAEDIVDAWVNSLQVVDSSYNVSKT